MSENGVPESQIHSVVPTGVNPPSATPWPDKGLVPLTHLQPPNPASAFNPEAQVVNQHPNASSGVPRGVDRPITYIDVRGNREKDGL